MIDPFRVGQERIAAPRGNNLAAIAPDRSTIPELLRGNHAYWNDTSLPRWIRDLRAEARRELVAVVDSYAKSYLSDGDMPARSMSDHGMWIMGGHQPELFHPGVWFKNILIDRLAAETSSIGLHAIVDHDLARGTSLRVPARDTDRGLAHAAMIPLPLRRPATSDPLLPWNAWRVEPSRIASTRIAIQQALSSVGISRSMASDFFQQLGELPSEIDAALALSQVRHRMECRRGLGNREFPMSQLCNIRAWRSFAGHCIANASELHATYNACLDEYRDSERITNPAQPVPRLGRQGEWIELPFWIRLPHQLSRHRMWVTHCGSQYRVATQPKDAGASIVWEERFWHEGWRIWPRALMTTLFLRIFLADLFVHGIGGGLYDRLTDGIIQRFLKIAPPGFVVCTATLWLAFPDCDPRWDEQLAIERAALERERQRLRSAPETFLDRQDPDQATLALAHRGMLETMPPRGQKKAWHAAMRHLRSQMVDATEPRRRDWAIRKSACDAKLIEQRITHSREFPFVLFEEEDVLARLARLAR